MRHIRDLLKSLDPSDAFNGVDCNSLSFLSVFTEGDLGGTGQKGFSGAVSVFVPLTPCFVKTQHNDQQSHVIQECRGTLGALSPFLLEELSEEGMLCFSALTFCFCPF